jgi:hypothetical protein
MDEAWPGVVVEEAGASGTLRTFLRSRRLRSRSCAAPRKRVALDQLEHEHDNIRRALEWARFRGRRRGAAFGWLALVVLGSARAPRGRSPLALEAARGCAEEGSF